MSATAELAVVSDSATEQPMIVHTLDVEYTGGLSAEQCLQLQECVTKFQLIQAQIGRDLFFMTQAIVQMKAILADKFEKFASKVLNIKPAYARRLEHINRMMHAHFADTNGRVNLFEINKISARALEMLTDDTPDIVIEEIKKTISNGNGKQVDISTVRQLLVRHEEEEKGHLEATLAEAERARRELEARLEKTEFERLKAIAQLQNAETNAKRLSQVNAALEEDLQRAQDQTVQVVEKKQTVEILPAGYVSAREAVEAAQRELSELSGYKHRVEEDLQRVVKEADELRNKLGQFRMGATEFLRIKDQVDQMILQVPPALIDQLASLEPEIQQAAATLGKSLVLLGNRLLSQKEAA